MSPTIARSAGENTPVRRLASHTLATVPPDATLQQVAEELAMDEIGVVVVEQGRETLGVVSERDLVAVIAAGGRLDAQATDLMTVDLVSAPEDTTVLEVARLMVDAGVRHVLVTSPAPEDDRDDGPVVGIVSMRDVVGFLLDDAV
ncbi:CBS domain-containing protein [Actinomycetospora chlora]|uniref:CBS domain-containing protein n=1 Tax=Actinomycetospora chlora TaxID=663608 RepID=A0ABP9AMY5_9PSEU